MKQYHIIFLRVISFSFLFFLLERGVAQKTEIFFQYDRFRENFSFHCVKIYELDIKTGPGPQNRVEPIKINFFVPYID